MSPSFRHRKRKSKAKLRVGRPTFPPGPPSFRYRPYLLFRNLKFISNIDRKQTRLKNEETRNIGRVDIFGARVSATHIHTQRHDTASSSCMSSSRRCSRHDRPGVLPAPVAQPDAGGGNTLKLVPSPPPPPPPQQQQRNFFSSFSPAQRAAAQAAAHSFVAPAIYPRARLRG